MAVNRKAAGSNPAGSAKNRYQKIMQTDLEQILAAQDERGFVEVLYKNQRCKVAYGDRWEKHNRYRFRAWVRCQDGRLELGLFSESDIVAGKYKDIYFPLAPRLGSSSLMGAVGKGIRNGRAFRVDSKKLR